MNKRQFVRQRRGAWTQFERLAHRFDTTRPRQLTTSEIQEYSQLFRQLAHDLAVVRSRQFGQELEQYLNHLVARGHNTFYRAPRGGPGAVAHFLAVGFPRLFRANLWYFVTAAALFFVPLAVTWCVVQLHPELGARVAEIEQLKEAANMYDYDPDARGEGSGPHDWQFDEERAAMGGFYVRHNVGIALRCFAGGLLLGTVTVYVLLSNGISIGAIAGYIMAQGHGRAFTSFVISHGAFELTAIAIAGGAGLMLGTALLHPGQRTRREALIVRGREAVQIAVGAAVMLMIAALLEAFWSPSGVPSLVKYIVGTGLWGLVCLYLAFAGRRGEG